MFWLTTGINPHSVLWTIEVAFCCLINDHSSKPAVAGLDDLMWWTNALYIHTIFMCPRRIHNFVLQYNIGLLACGIKSQVLAFLLFYFKFFIRHSMIHTRFQHFTFITLNEMKKNEKERGIFVRVYQSELSRPNSVESDHGCTMRIYFDNTGENVMLTWYNVTLTSQKPC